MDALAVAGVMLALALPDGPLRLACVGAHSDDIEIGAGATIVRLLAEHPGSTVDWVVLSATPERRAEAEASVGELITGVDALRLHLEGLPDTFLPWHGEAVKHALRGVATAAPHDLVLAPALHDRHQDHRAVAEAVHQTWRDQPIWSYEIAKWEGDLRTPNLYVRLDDEQVERKLDHLARHFPSQHAHLWYDRDAFAGLMRLRGVECNTRWAEGFHVLKTAI